MSAQSQIYSLWALAGTYQPNLVAQMGPIPRSTEAGSVSVREQMPQLPVMSLTVPIKTLTGLAILAGSLALWPRFIEARFAGLLDLAERLIAAPAGASLGG